MPEPTDNLLIATLPQAEYRLLQPHLELASLDAGTMVSAGAGLGHRLYFPVDCAMSMLHADKDGLNEIAIIGNEGVAGITLVLLGEPALNRFTALNAGCAYTLQSEVLARHFSLDSSLRQLLFNYSQVLITQMGQNAYCRHHHSLKQQLGRWLLDYQSHLPHTPLKIRLSLLAEILGMPAEEVVDAAQGLPGCRLEVSEDNLVVLDRRALQAGACGCHGLMQAKISHWLPYRAAARA